MAKTPKAKFMMLGKSKYVHAVHTEAYDRKNSECQQVRKFLVAGKIDYKAKGLSAEAASALDPCDHCATTVAIEAMTPASDKAQQRKDKRDETLAKFNTKAKDSVKAAFKPETVKAKAKSKVKAVKESKDVTPKVPTKTKSGVRSVGSGTDAKAKALCTFMSDNGWAASIEEDKDTGHTVVHGTKGDQIINAYFIDGKYDVARHATLHVGSWSGTLRGAHAVRRQVDLDLDDRDRPHPKPGVGRSGPRKRNDEEPVQEDESPEDARRRVPFNLDDEDIVIIDMLKGNRIRWRNGVTNRVEEAVVPTQSQRTKVTTNPKNDRRIISFLEVDSVGEHGEVYGGERNVYLDKIVRVVE